MARRWGVGYWSKFNERKERELMFRSAQWQMELEATRVIVEVHEERDPDEPPSRFGTPPWKTRRH